MGTFIKLWTLALKINVQYQYQIYIERIYKFLGTSFNDRPKFTYWKESNFKDVQFSWIDYC